MVDPYRRWRNGVHYAGVVVVCLLTLVVLAGLLALVVTIFTRSHSG